MYIIIDFFLFIYIFEYRNVTTKLKFIFLTFIKNFQFNYFLPDCKIAIDKMDQSTPLFILKSNFESWFFVSTFPKYFQFYSCNLLIIGYCLYLGWKRFLSLANWSQVCTLGAWQTRASPLFNLRRRQLVLLAFSFFLLIYYTYTLYLK